MTEKKNCISRNEDGQVVYCVDYKKCWIGGRLRGNNPCGYVPPRTATLGKSIERQLSDIAVIRTAKKPKTGTVEKD